MDTALDEEIRSDLSEIFWPTPLAEVRYVSFLQQVQYDAAMARYAARQVR